MAIPTRKQLERLAWQATHRDFRTPWNGGDASLLRMVEGVGTCSIPLSQWSDADLRAKAGRKLAEWEQKQAAKGK